MVLHIEILPQKGETHQYYNWKILKYKNYKFYWIVTVSVGISKLNFLSFYQIYCATDTKDYLTSVLKHNFWWNLIKFRGLLAFMSSKIIYKWRQHMLWASNVQSSNNFKFVNIWLQKIVLLTHTPKKTIFHDENRTGLSEKSMLALILVLWCYNQHVILIMHFMFKLCPMNILYI